MSALVRPLGVPPKLGAKVPLLTVMMEMRARLILVMTHLGVSTQTLIVMTVMLVLKIVACTILDALIRCWTATTMMHAQMTLATTNLGV
jgi:hypothetical protein